MQIVSVINYKGGVGKTTLTANLGAEIARRGQKVLLIDIDPQASLTFSFLTPRQWKEFEDDRTIKNWYDSLVNEKPLNIGGIRLEPTAVKKRLPEQGQLHLIASHLDLLEVDLLLAQQLVSMTPAQMQFNYCRVHTHLDRALRGLPQDLYDLVLIDCPPSFSLVTKNAILASDYLLCPTRPDYVSTLGIQYLLNRVQRLVCDFNAIAQPGMPPLVPPDLLGVIFTMVEYHNGQPIAAQRQSMNQIERSLQGPNSPPVYFFSTSMRLNNTRFGDAPERGIPYVLSGDTRPPGPEIIRELQDLADEFKMQLDKGPANAGKHGSTVRTMPELTGAGT